MKFKSKSWITLGLQKSISVKNKLILHFMKKVKRLIIINILKQIRIILRTHGKESNLLFLLKTEFFFELSAGNIIDSYDMLTLSFYIWNYEKSIKYLHKYFSDYLANESGSKIFLQTTDKEEIANIILARLIPRNRRKRQKSRKWREISQKSPNT